MTQEDRILSYLRRKGSISGREAMIDLSVQSLTRRITELRDRGYNIRGEWRRHPVTGQRYVRYFYEPEAEAA